MRLKRNPPLDPPLRPRPRRGHGDRERGAVTALVSVLLGGAVLLGMAAIVIDVGQIYLEREELQTGADAAVMAVARTCALDPACDPRAIADTYADRNARDGASTVVLTCGRGWNLSSGTTHTCPDRPARVNLAACLSDYPASGPFVEVRTATGRPDGSTLLPPTFARGLAGRGQDPGTRVSACARASLPPLGPPLEMPAPAITIEVCYHRWFTGNGTSYPVTERAVYLKDGTGGDPCNATSSAGANGPGNFGWLDHSGTCVGRFSTDGPRTGGSPGVSTDSACRTLFDRYIDRREPMPIPLFDSVTDTGQNLRYHLVGFAAFMITGYQFSGSDRPSRLTGQHLCGGAERCLYGYFVRAEFPAVRAGNGTDYGASSIGTAKIVG